MGAVRQLDVYGVEFLAVHTTYIAIQCTCEVIKGLVLATAPCVRISIRKLTQTNKHQNDTHQIEHMCTMKLFMCMYVSILYLCLYAVHSKYTLRYVKF